MNSIRSVYMSLTVLLAFIYAVTILFPRLCNGSPTALALGIVPCHDIAMAVRGIAAWHAYADGAESTGLNIRARFEVLGPGTLIIDSIPQMHDIYRNTLRWNLNWKIVLDILTHMFCIVLTGLSARCLNSKMIFPENPQHH